MSTEDSTPPEGLRVQVIDLRGVMREGLLDSLATCVAIVRVIQQNIDEHPKAVEGVLFGAWMVVVKQLRGTVIDNHSVPFLGEYFRHAGDWGAMRRCMIEEGEKHQSAPGQFTALCDQKFDQALREFADQIAHVAAPGSH